MKANNIIYPDYQNSIVNLIASILSAYDAEIGHKPLVQLPKDKFSRNLVLLILDGFGLNLLQTYKKDVLSFLEEHFDSQLTSVFPSTTAAAITSFQTGKTPLEHGSIGWTIFFKEYARYIDFLPIWDSATTTILDEQKYPVYNILGSENIFRKIKRSKPEIELFNITPKRLAKKANLIMNSNPAKILSHNSPKQLFKQIEKAIKKQRDQRKFVYAYSTEPDHLEHIHGIDSQEVKACLADLNNRIAKLAKRLQGSETTLLITADHGLTNIDQYLYVNEDKELFDSIILPGFPEPRFISFFVKKHKFAQFEMAVQKYKDDFLIMSRDEFLKQGFLGQGKPHEKIDDFIGDFVLLAKAAKALKPIYEQSGKWKKEFAAHHAGITAAEMLVPLFKIDV